MKTRDFCFELPSDLVAQAPESDRQNARLLVVRRDTGSLVHARVRDLPDFIGAETLQVMNDSRVRKSRLFSGDGSEFLFLERLGPSGWSVLVHRSRTGRKLTRFEFPDGISAELEPSPGMQKSAIFSRPLDDDYLERHGHVPLPPYIRRPDNSSDIADYQTVYARRPGSAAAPTAGLHFSPALLEALRKGGVGSAFVTLHVGLGTFLPIKSENLEDHLMHEEWYEVPEETANSVDAAREKGGRILAVGTTSLRTLESAAVIRNDPAGPDTPPVWRLQAGPGRTSLFIAPGYRFRLVDRLLTNFHTPRSSLLVLVSAFAGYALVMGAYAEAVRRRYRFFSYGDAMLIL
jgi:S-adenosylmethionine:tRNA ribosyltransferase-isomerase